MSRVFILSEATGPRLSVALATEIGLKQSILLLQIEYWVSVSGHIRDGQKWTRQSLKNLKAQFPFMSKATINRTIDDLERDNLIIVTMQYNKRKGDKTRWFAINEEGCNQLKSIRVIKLKETLSQNGTTLFQNETTLPNELQNERHNIAHVESEPEWDASAYDVDRFDSWVDDGVDLLDPQPFLSPKFSPKEKTRQSPILEPIPKSAHSIMYRICYRAETESEQLLLSSTQRGKVASVLGQMRDAGANFHKLHIFEDWWMSNWRSKDRVTKQYQAPRPEQVLEFWNEAMKSDVKPTPVEIERPKHDITDLTSIMRGRRTN